MLGLPLACKQLVRDAQQPSDPCSALANIRLKQYNETMQRVYSRPEFHFYFGELILLWAKQTPKMYHTALTCVTVTSMSFDAQNPKTYKEAWEFLAALSNLQSLSVFVAGKNDADLWDDSLQEMAEPIAKVQQHTLTHFDLIFYITPTWFPDDCYLKINYNKLHWDTFSIDRAEYSVFDGLHSKCRLIGMNGYLLYRPILQVLPTAQELTEWIECFSCNAAYGLDEPDGYDPDEIGEQAMAAQRIKDAQPTESADDKGNEFEKLRDELEDKYLYGPDCDNDPEHWDLAAIDRLADHMEMPNSYFETPHWYYPEKPSWVTEDEP